MQLLFVKCQVEDYQNILKLSFRPLAFTSYKAVLKSKQRFETSLHVFGMLFEEKYFSCYILLPDQISLSGYLYFERYWITCALQLFVNQVVTS